MLDFPDPYNLHLILWGMVTLLAATVPNLLKSRNITAPIVYMIIGIAIFYFTGNYATLRSFQADTVEKICEFVVLISLVNAGLKIREPFKWRTWRHSFFLLAITMPLTIVAAAFIGWWVLGFGPAAAVLFGAVISPTDPVLASDLQTSRPSKEDISKTRLALTSEAGINDGLAFPFVYFALTMAKQPNNFDWLGSWFLSDVIYKTGIGVAMGLLMGWLFYQLIFTLTAKDHHSKISRGILSLALTLIPYAVTEIFGGYGFIAVFITACAFSNSERIIKHMDSMHDFTEEIERIFVTVLFVMIGIYVCASWKQLLDIKIIGAALLVLIVIRPLFGWLALIGSRLSNFERFVMSFYGIRGVGSIYYLMFAINHFTFDEAPMLVQVTTMTITLSVIIHGISAASIQKRLDKYDGS